MMLCATYVASRVACIHDATLLHATRKVTWLYVLINAVGMDAMCDSDEGFLAVAAACAVIACRQTKRKRICWTRPWLRRRQMSGAYHCLVKDGTQCCLAMLLLKVALDTNVR